MQVVILLFLFFLLVPIHEVFGQHNVIYIPYKDTLDQNYVLYNLRDSQYEKVKYDWASVLTGFKENYILLRNKNRSILLNNKYEMILSESFDIKQMIHLEKFSHCAIVIANNEVGVFDIEKKEYLLPPMRGDRYRLLRDSILFSYDNRGSEIYYVNIMSGKAGMVKASGMALTFHIQGLQWGDLFNYSNLAGVGALFSIDDGKEIYPDSPAGYYQVNSRTVFVRDQVSGLKRIDLSSRTIFQTTYSDINPVQYSSSHFLLSQGKKYFLVDSSLNQIKVFTRKPALVYVAGNFFSKKNGKFLQLGAKKRGTKPVSFEKVIFYNSHFYLQREGNTILINSEGRKIGVFTGIMKNVNDIWLSIKLLGGKYALYNTSTGEKILESLTNLVYLNNSSDTLFISQSNGPGGNLGLVSKKGELVLPHRYQMISEQVGSFFWVIGPGKTGAYFVDIKGKEYLK